MSTVTEPQDVERDQATEPTYQWKRSQSTDWFSNYREPNPDVELPPAISSFFGGTILLSLVACFYLGPLEMQIRQLNERLLEVVEAAYFFLICGAAFYALRFYVWNKQTMKPQIWELPFCLLVLFAFLLISDLRCGFFPFAAAFLGLNYVVTGDLIVVGCISRKALALPMASGTFIRDVIIRRRAGQLSEEKRTEDLNRSFWQYVRSDDLSLHRIPEDSPQARNIYIRNVNLARCFDALRIASRKHVRLYAFLLAASFAVGFGVTIVAARRGFDYWQPQIYLAVAGLIVLSVAWSICSYDTKSSYQRNVDKDFANRSWLAANPANCWRAAFLLALSTIVVCRTANYFPVFPVHRVEIASTYLESQGLPSSPEHATAFLNALPENWLIASVDWIRNSSHIEALPHLSSLILSGLLCVYISRSVFSIMLSLLLDPAVPNFAHEMALFERSAKMGIIRELQQQDMEFDLPSARDGEGS